MKVAVASSDGKIINQHFGKAAQFLIFELKKGSYKFLGLRLNRPACQAGEFTSHDPAGLEATLDNISDCKIVLCSRYGAGIKELLCGKGITIIEAPVRIEDGLKLARKKAPRKVQLPPASI